MNRHRIGAIFVATFGAALTLAGTTALAGKPVPTDACATATDFPAFAYRVLASGKNPSTIYLADATGKCSRKLVAGTVPKLSYPVDGDANKGRVVWVGELNSIYAVDFTVGAGNTIAIGASRLLLTNASGSSALDLSKDGQTVYFSDTTSSVASFDVSTQVVTPIYSLSPDDSSWFFMTVSVNGDGTQLYATKYGIGSGGSQMVRIDLTATPVSAVLLREWLPHTGYGAHVFAPAANQYDDRVAFVEYIEGTNNCTPLVVTDWQGNQLFPSQPAPARYGRYPTWAGNNVVMERRGAMDGSGKCASTTSLSQINLTNNAETVLNNGVQPDGR